MRNPWKLFEQNQECVCVFDMESKEMVYANPALQKRMPKTWKQTVFINHLHNNLHHQSNPSQQNNLNQDTQHHQNIQGSQNSLDHHHGSGSLFDLDHLPFPIVQEMQANEEGRTYKILILDAGSQQNEEPEESLESLTNTALGLVMQQHNANNSIPIILEYVGKTLQGDRAYLFEKNLNGWDTKIAEWTKDGIKPDVDWLKNVEPEIFAGWFEEFHRCSKVVIHDIEDVKEVNPELYERLKKQKAKRMAAVPLIKDEKVFGFYGVANPSEQLLNRAADLLAMISPFLVAVLEERNLSDAEEHTRK